MSPSTLLGAPEFKVGLLVLIVSGIIATMALKVSEDPSYLGGSKESFFLLDDASGLVKNSAVKMAGIDVGIIKDITLEKGEAKVRMIIKGEIPITKSARIEIRPNGILGDKHVEIVAGDPRDPPLRSGEQILIVDDRASVDRLIGEVSKITKSLTAVADNIKAATEGDGDKPLGRIVLNIEQLTSDLAELSKNKKGKVGEIIDNVHSISTSIDDLINDESDEGFKHAWKKALKSLSRVEVSLKNIEEITDKVNRGEGTLGKLVNDETTVEELNTAIDGVNNFLDTASKIQTSIDFHADYLQRDSLTKTTLNLHLQPGLDRFYEVGIVDDPRGVVETQEIKTSTDSTSSSVKEERRFRNKVKFNALIGKNFYNFSLKGGVIESSGGVGADVYFLKKSLRFSVDAYNFSDFHLRTYARYTLFKGIYLMGGGDDLTNSRNSSFFVGGGLFLTNDDLKMLVSKVPL